MKKKTQESKATKKDSALPNPQSPETLHVNEYGIASTDQAQLEAKVSGYQGPAISGQEAVKTQTVNEKGERLNADGSVYEDWSKADESGELSKQVDNLTGSAFTIVPNGDTFTVIRVRINPIGGEKSRMEVMREGLSKEDAEELFKATAAKELFKK